MELIKTVDQAFIENRPLSPSSLKKFAESPKHYIQYLNTPFEKSEAMLLGDVVDCLVLTPKLLEKKFLVHAKPNRRTKEGKEEYQILLDTAKKDKLTLVDTSVVEKAEIIRDALLDHEEAKQLIEAKSNVQKKLEWRDKANNLPLRGFIDFESKAWESDFIVDLKTAKSSDPEQFIRDAANLRYQFQAAGYTDAYHKKYYKFPGFIFLVVETVEPFNVSVIICDDKYMEKAKEEYFGTLKAFRYCLDHQHFDMGYDFRLFGVKDYFNMQIPGYYKQSYPPGFGEEDPEEE